MDHQELFNQICKPQIDEIKSTTEQILAALKGKDADTPGLCERVRDVEKFQRTIVKVGGMIGGVVVIEVVVTLIGWLMKATGS